MTLDLARLEALAAAATPGPWHTGAPSKWAVDDRCVADEAGNDICDTEDFGPKDHENAAFIAACDPTTVRALCARIRALEAALRPLAEHDCESWGCDPLVTAHDCAPARARALLDGTA